MATDTNTVEAQYEIIFKALEAMTAQLVAVATGRQDCSLPKRRATLFHRLGWAVKQLDLSTLLQDSEFFLARIVNTHAIGGHDPLVLKVQTYLQATTAYYASRGVSLPDNGPLLDSKTPCYSTVSANFDEVQGNTIDRMIEIAQMLCAPAILTRMRRMAHASSKPVSPTEEREERLKKLSRSTLQEGSQILLDVVDLLAFHTRLQTNTGPGVALMLQRAHELHRLSEEKRKEGDQKGAGADEEDGWPSSLELITAAVFPCETDDDDLDGEEAEEAVPCSSIEACNPPHSYYVKLKQKEELRIQVSTLLAHMMVEMAYFFYHRIALAAGKMRCTSCPDGPHLIEPMDGILEKLYGIVAERFDMKLFLTDSVAPQQHVTKLPGWQCLAEGQAVPPEALVTVTDVRIDEAARVSVTVSHRDPKFAQPQKEGEASSASGDQSATEKSSSSVDKKMDELTLATKTTNVVEGTK